MKVGEQKISRVLSVSTFEDRERGVDLTRDASPAERLAMLERLRQDTAKLLGHEYPSRIQRILEVAHR